MLECLVKVGVVMGGIDGELGERAGVLDDLVGFIGDVGGLLGDIGSQNNFFFCCTNGSAW